MTMAGLPRLIRPMLVSLRHELPADEESYGWELKWDGLRAIAYVSGSTIRLVSRNDKDMAASYPELGVLAERVSAPVILDGEIVALRGGRPDFGLLQSRMHVRSPTHTLLRRRRSGSTQHAHRPAAPAGVAGACGEPVRYEYSGPAGSRRPVVEPRLVGEVAFAYCTSDGILRQPSWRGLPSTSACTARRRQAA